MGGHDEKVKPRVQVKHVAVGVFAFLTVAALVTRERHYRQRLEHDHQVQQGVCEAQAFRPPLPGSIDLFPTKQAPHSQQLPECNGIVLVQSDSRELALDFKEVDFRNSHREAPGVVPGDILTLSAMINRGYAQTHGYCHVWARCTARERHPAWCKVKAMEYAVKRYPKSDILYLESDAYVRTQLPMDTSVVREHGAAAAFTLSCQWFPYVHSLVAALGGGSGRGGGGGGGNDTTAAEVLPLMGDHLTLFHSGEYMRAPGGAGRGGAPAAPPQALATSVFLIMGGPQALPLLQAWWDAAPSKGAQDGDSCSAALNALMEQAAETRQSTELLDYPTYNGPNGEFIRHMDNNRGADALFKHDVADTLLKHADKTTLYFAELYGDLFRTDVDV